jgi:hypothetical protein
MENGENPYSSPASTEFSPLERGNDEPARYSCATLGLVCMTTFAFFGVLDSLLLNFQVVLEGGQLQWGDAWGFFAALGVMVLLLAASILFVKRDLQRGHLGIVTEKNDNPFLSPFSQVQSRSKRFKKKQKPFARFAFSAAILFFLAISLVVGVFVSQLLLLNWPGRTLSPLVFLLYMVFGIAIIVGQFWIRDPGWGAAYLMLSLAISFCCWCICWYIVSARALMEM